MKDLAKTAEEEIVVTVAAIPKIER